MTQHGLSSAGIAELMELARTAGRRAADLIEAERPDVLGVADTKSSPTDVVTEMDRASEQLLRDVLGSARPNDGFLGEEYGHQPGTSGLTWVLDPIDGTVNYLYRLPAYAVSVGLVEGDPSVEGAWTPLAACVVAPATGDVWTAGAGAGAFHNDRRLVMAPPPSLEQALVATGFGYAAERRAQGTVLARLLPAVRDIRRVGSAAVDLCWLAMGRTDAYYEQGVHTWDIAAAALVVREAGGELVGLDGGPPTEKLMVAAVEPLLGQLRSALEAAGVAELWIPGL
jgi:myo-inositol-1(or 4)-monophosphatase